MHSSGTSFFGYLFIRDIDSQRDLGYFLGHLIKRHQILIKMASNESENAMFVFVLGQRKGKQVWSKTKNMHLLSRRAEICA